MIFIRINTSEWVPCFLRAVDDHKQTTTTTATEWDPIIICTASRSYNR